jgi:hypothetical protein
LLPPKSERERDVRRRQENPFIFSIERTRVALLWVFRELNKDDESEIWPVVKMALRNMHAALSSRQLL